jgi:hypothetical protein
VAVLSPRLAEACGGGGVTTVTSSSQAAVANSQRIVLAYHPDPQNQRTEIIAQIGVPAADSDYGVLIPVPGRPEIDPEPVSIDDLDALDRDTQPTIVTVQEVASGDGGGTGCGCGSADDDSSRKGDQAGSSAVVSVSAPVNVGPATAVVLESDDGSALTEWLDENGFAIPSEHQAIVDHYVEMGDAFIAIRRSDTAPPDGPTSLGLHYTLTGDHRQLSLAFARIGAAPTVSFTVFVTAPTIAFPNGFAALELGQLSQSTLRTSYSAAVARAVATYGSHAFVMEGTYGPGSSWSVSHEFAMLLGIDSIKGRNFTTRASTIVAAEALDTDVRFDLQGDTVSNSVTIHAAGARLPRSRESSVGVLALVLASRALRRRFRRQ